MLGMFHALGVVTHHDIMSTTTLATRMTFDQLSRMLRHILPQGNYSIRVSTRVWKMVRHESKCGALTDNLADTTPRQRYTVRHNFVAVSQQSIRYPERAAN